MERRRQEENLYLEKRKREAEIVALQSQLDSHLISNLFASMQLLLRMGEELRAGKAEASPLAHTPAEDPCRYCEYGRVCGFDAKRQEKRLIRRITDAEFWQLAQREAEHG